MTYVLILLVLTGDVLEAAQMRFSSEASCERVKARVIALWAERAVPIRGECVPAP